MWSVRLWPPTLRANPALRSLSTFRGRSTNRGPRGSIIRPNRVPLSRRPEPTSQDEQPTIPETQNAQNPNYDPSQNTLLAPVHIPEDPHAVLKESHPATNLLANSGLVVQRQLEMMNVMM